MTLQEQLEAAERDVERLKRQIGSASCQEIGAHDWVFQGGCNAGCSQCCACSVPVHECSRCGDCDYGKNVEADEVRRVCLENQEQS